MKQLALQTLIFYVILLSPLSCFSKDNEAKLTEVVKKEAHKFLSDKRFSSVSIAVYNKGKSYVGHFGELDYNMGNKPTDQTLYEIASVTKTMTGYLVAGAIYEGKFTLDTTIHEILGDDFRNFYFKGVPVCIRHLLTHTSGMQANISKVSELYAEPNANSYKKAQEILTNYTQNDFLEEMKSISLNRPPGKTYSYSNVAPNLLAYILEKVYEKKFDVLLKEKLFDPANMLNTSINLDIDQQLLLANGYNDKNERMPIFRHPITLWGAAGRVKSNSNDLLNYIKWQLNMDNPVVQLSHQSLFHDIDNIWIGYYWEIIKGKSNVHIEHHGGLYGNQNWLILHPDESFGISIISNSSFPEANRLIKESAQRIFERTL